MTGYDLLNYLVQQTEESLESDITIFVRDTKEFFPLKKAYIHDEQDPVHGDVLDSGCIVLVTE